MLSPQTQTKIRQLEIVTKRLMDGPLVGDDVSARRGYGVELDQLREYQFGDDVRFIDFKSSCRLNKMMIKECIEERNRRIILAVDVSASSFYGSDAQRFTLVQDAAAILALAAQHAHDSVGLIFFSDELECTLQPVHTKQHINFLLQKLYSYKAVAPKKTCMDNLFKSIAQQWRKDAIVFVISDFIVDDIDQSLRAAAVCVDLIALRCYDQVERTMPHAGYVTVEDVEYGTQVLVESARGASVGRVLAQRKAHQDALFARAGIDVLDITHEQDICARLVDLFKRRMMHASLRYG